MGYKNIDFEKKKNIDFDNGYIYAKHKPSGFGGIKLWYFAHQFRIKRSGECPKRSGLCC